jgi:hypothetical protein
MHSPDTSAESRSPLKPATPALEGADNPSAGALRLAVGRCVAGDQDGIETLRRCVRAARAEGVKPERVVMVVHAAWDKYAASVGEHDMRRLRLTGVALDAYFGDD